jgi:hypothetical protein
MATGGSRVIGRVLLGVVVAVVLVIAGLAVALIYPGTPGPEQADLRRQRRRQGRDDCPVQTIPATAHPPRHSYVADRRRPGLVGGSIPAFTGSIRPAGRACCR